MQQLSSINFHKAIPWILTLTILIPYMLTQDVIQVRNGAGWDGFIYFRMVNPDVVGPLPFGLRIAVPTAVRWTSITSDVITNFLIINLFIGALYSIFSYVILRRLFPGASMLGLVLSWAILNISELSIVRFSAWYPANTDSLANLMFLGVVWCCLLMESTPIKRSMGLFLVFLIGTMTRENFIINIGFVMAITQLVFRDGKVVVSLSRQSISPVVASILGCLCAILIIRIDTGYWIFHEKTSAVLKWYEAQRVFTVILAVVMVYGFNILVTVAAMGKSVASSRYTHQIRLFWLASFVVAIIGGGNTERFLYWYMVLVAILTMPYLEHLLRERTTQGLVSLLVAFGYFAVFHRIFVSIDILQPQWKSVIASGCEIGDYITGLSPHLFHFTSVCTAHSTPPYLVAFLGCLGVVVLVSKVSLTFSDRQDSSVDSD